MRRLPPLSAVRVFEAAARHENFTAAANELGLTQAAVSYQIRLLEERLGVALFRREKRRVTLTGPGRRIAGRLTAAFDAIDGAFAELRADDDALLTIATTETFANGWLASRLGGFQLACPGIAVRLVSGSALSDFAADEVDVAIRSGRGEWPGLTAERLLTVDFTPMCSPGFLATHGGTLAPADLARLPLISPGDIWWRLWLDEAGVSPPEQPGRVGIRLDTQTQEALAAMAGQGLAMLTPFFWRREMAEGRLVRPFAQVSSRGYGYWLVHLESRRTVAKIRRFRDWIVAEMNRDEAGPTA